MGDERRDIIKYEGEGRCSSRICIIVPTYSHHAMRKLEFCNSWNWDEQRKENWIELVFVVFEPNDKEKLKLIKVTR